MLKRSILDSITRFVLSGTCAASFLTIPVQPLSAQDYCPPSDCCEQDPCCNGGSGFGKTALIIGGAAVVGGIAGAIAGRSSGHRGHDGDSGNDGERGARGPRGLPGTTGAMGATGATGAPGPTGATGPTGPSPFVTDPDQALVFFLSVTDITLTLPAGDALTFVPFVSRPDGVVITGTPRPQVGPFGIDTPITPSLIGEFDPISIENPIFGTYQAGVQVIFSEGSSQITVGTIETFAGVVSSRDNSTTATETSFATDLTLDPLNTIQTHSGFTYGLGV